MLFESDYDQSSSDEDDLDMALFECMFSSSKFSLTWLNLEDLTTGNVKKCSGTFYCNNKIKMNDLLFRLIRIIKFL